MGGVARGTEYARGQVSGDSSARERGGSRGLLGRRGAQGRVRREGGQELGASSSFCFCALFFFVFAFFVFCSLGGAGGAGAPLVR